MNYDVMKVKYLKAKKQDLMFIENKPRVFLLFWEIYLIFLS